MVVCFQEERLRFWTRKLEISFIRDLSRAGEVNQSLGKSTYWDWCLGCEQTMGDCWEATTWAEQDMLEELHVPSGVEVCVATQRAAERSLLSVIILILK